MDLNKKTAVITGGAGGIGSALAAELHSRGAQLVIADLDLDKASAVAEPLNGKAFTCDVANEQHINDLIAFAESSFGQVDIFVSNAGFGLMEPDHAASSSNDIWQSQWEVHVMSHVYAARNLLPKMIARGDGYLVNTASAAGLLAQIGDAAYSATKHAAVSFAESLHIRHADQGVKVSVICPQYVNTDIIGAAKVEAGDLPDWLLSPQQCANIVADGLEQETFMILPHPEVAKFYALRAADTPRWLAGMQQLKSKLIAEDGSIDLGRMYTKD